MRVAVIYAVAFLFQDGASWTSVGLPLELLIVDIVVVVTDVVFHVTSVFVDDVVTII